jgi:hypothetical protein
VTAILLGIFSPDKDVLISDKGEYTFISIKPMLLKTYHPPPRPATRDLNKNEKAPATAVPAAKQHRHRGSRRHGRDVRKYFPGSIASCEA